MSKQHPPRPGPAIARRNLPVAAVGGLITAALLVTGCSQQENTATATATAADSQPSSTASTTPTPSPTPSPTASVSAREQRAYEQALAVVREHLATVAEVVSRPSLKRINLLSKTATDPYFQQVSGNIRKQVDFDQRGVVRHEVVSAEPVEVRLQPQRKIWLSGGKWKPFNYRLTYETPVVVLDACSRAAVVEQLTVHGKPARNKESRPGYEEFGTGRYTLTQPPYRKGGWAVAWVVSKPVPSC